MSHHLFSAELAVGLGLILAGLSDAIAGWLIEVIARTC
jgi:F0F1-type ATP synthase membrane subunit c/vacuolar-type H+-ATPase subunit K